MTCGGAPRVSRTAAGTGVDCRTAVVIIDIDSYGTGAHRRPVTVLPSAEMSKRSALMVITTGGGASVAGDGAPSVSSVTSAAMTLRLTHRHPTAAARDLAAIERGLGDRMRARRV